MPDATKSYDWAVFLIVSAMLLSIAPAHVGAATSGGRVYLKESIKAVPPGEPPSRPHRVREALTAGELGKMMDLVISLRMRRFAEFQVMVQSGRTISRAQMEANYLPSQADYDRVASWLRAQGLVPTMVDGNWTNLFFRGTVAEITTAFGVCLARESIL